MSSNMPSKKKRDLPALEHRNWYTIEEAAMRLEVAVSSMYRHIQQGRIEYRVLPLSKKRVFDKEKIETFRKEELGISDSPSELPTWPGADSERLPPGAKITQFLVR